MPPEGPQLVAVEDDEVDILALQRAFSRRGLSGRLTIFTDSVDAWERIQAGLPWPFVLLLDLAMPRLSGLELLALLRQDPRLAATDVYLITTSRHPRELLKARSLGARAFLSKDELAPDYTLLFDLLATHGHLPG